MVLLIQLNFVIMVNITKLVILMFLNQVQKCKELSCFVFFFFLFWKYQYLLSAFAWNREKKVFLLFIFGTESCVFSKLCKWWRRGGGGMLRRRCFVSSFSNCYFSDKMNQNRLIQYKNSYFLLSIFKNRLKWIKNPSLHDSPWQANVATSIEIVALGP